VYPKCAPEKIFKLSFSIFFVSLSLSLTAPGFSFLQNERNPPQELFMLAKSVMHSNFNILSHNSFIHLFHTSHIGDDLEFVSTCPQAML
jgi:hypothetical protein